MNEACPYVKCYPQCAQLIILLDHSVTKYQTHAAQSSVEEILNQPFFVNLASWSVQPMSIFKNKNVAACLKAPPSSSEPQHLVSQTHVTLSEDRVNSMQIQEASKLEEQVFGRHEQVRKKNPADT